MLASMLVLHFRFPSPSITDPVSLPSPPPISTPPPTVPFSPPNPTKSLFAQSSHHSRGLPPLLQPSTPNASPLCQLFPFRSFQVCPAHFNLLLTSYLLKPSFTPNSSLSSSILSASTLFTPTCFFPRYFGKLALSLDIFPSSLWFRGHTGTHHSMIQHLICSSFCQFQETSLNLSSKC